MKIVRGIVSVITALALSVAFVAAGFAACLAPPVTHGLSSVFAKDDLSPFSRAQLVRVADATRDYSFGDHDELALYRVVYQVDLEYQRSIEDAGGAVPADFPHIGQVNAMSGLEQMRAAFAGASELYCFSSQTVSHLDDCYKIASAAFPPLVVAAAVALVGMVFVGVSARKRSLGAVLVAAGVIVVVAFAGLGIWAAVDFTGFFGAFHQLFFSQGNWTFPYDSLLICSLPTEFWMGMGVVWLATAIVLSVVSILVGARLRGRRSRRA